MLVSHLDFVGPLTVASVDTLPVMETLNLFIKQREPEVLTDVYGQDGYATLLELDQSLTSSVEVIQQNPIVGTGIFYVQNIVEKLKIENYSYFIKVEGSSGPVRPMALAESDDNNLSDYLKTSSFYQNDLTINALMCYDCFDNNGSLGSISIDKLFQCKIESPELWGLIDTNISLIDLISLSDLKSAKFSKFGFSLGNNNFTSFIQGIKFKDKLYYFGNKFGLNIAKKIASHFIWYWYSRHINSTTTGSGQTRTKSENAYNVDPAEKQAQIWNEMSDLIFCYRDGINIIDDRKVRCKYAKINVLNF